MFVDGVVTLALCKGHPSCFVISDVTNIQTPSGIHNSVMNPFYVRDDGAIFHQV